MVRTRQPEPMYFRYHPEIKQTFPSLVTAVVEVSTVDAIRDTPVTVASCLDTAQARLQTGPESTFPEIQAWRQVFVTMGLKPTKYRSAAEALLRRLRKEGSLPPIHPLVDLCNAVSVAHATPVAVFDLAEVAGDLCVRPARGDETFLTFSDEVQHPEPNEIVFADDDAQAHARRWAHRQSARSTIRDSTTRALIVAEAHHPTAPDDIRKLHDLLCKAMDASGGSIGHSAILLGGDLDLAIPAR